MRRLLQPLLWSALLASLSLAALQLAKVYSVHRENRLIAEWGGQAGNASEAGPAYGNTPEIRLARAVFLVRKKRYDDALAVLNLILEQGDSRLRTQSRYNLGNLYLDQAMAEVDAGRPNQALPLLTLAKQAYRQALALDSQFWDAKYNLELAMRLLPEFDRIAQGEADDDAAAPSALWSTVPGFPRGLP